MKNLLNLLMAVVSLVVIMSLSACLLPEDFEASITVKRDGSYTFNYDGNLVHIMALSAIMEDKLSKEDAAALKEQEKELRDSPGFKKAKYIGNARYKVSVEHSGKAGEDYYFTDKEMSMFSIKGQDDGTLAIKALKLNEKDMKMLTALDFDIVGKLSVSVAKGLKVIEHNAGSVSSGVYRWKIKNPETAPLIIVKP